MSRVYVIADLHLGHRRVALARGYATPEAHDAALEAAWNGVVTKRDVVYVLGDVFNVAGLARLKGTKKLALGNHDTRPPAVYLQHVSKVAAYYEYDGCLLSHIPVHESQSRRWRLNVHGHTHTRTVGSPWYVNVSVEACVRMAPYRLDHITAAVLAPRRADDEAPVGVRSRSEACPIHWKGAPHNPSILDANRCGWCGCQLAPAAATGAVSRGSPSALERILTWASEYRYSSPFPADTPDAARAEHASLLRERDEALKELAALRGGPGIGVVMGWPVEDWRVLQNEGLMRWDETSPTKIAERIDTTIEGLKAQLTAQSAECARLREELLGQRCANELIAKGGAEALLKDVVFTTQRAEIAALTARAGNKEEA